jgi:hypothetical protein
MRLRIVLPNVKPETITVPTSIIHAAQLAFDPLATEDAVARQPLQSTGGSRNLFASCRSAGRHKRLGHLTGCQDHQPACLFAEVACHGLCVPGHQITRWRRARKDHDHDGTWGMLQDLARRTSGYHASDLLSERVLVTTKHDAVNAQFLCRLHNFVSRCPLAPKQLDPISRQPALRERQTGSP